MEHRSLILLGLLMVQSQHGYQINEFIERNLSIVTDMKKPTAYATLDKLSQKGYIEVQTEQEGNRPPRKVYSINDKGKQYFYKLLLNNLTSAESVNYHGDVGLMFINHLPGEQARSALLEKLDKEKRLLSTLKQAPSHEATGVNLAIKHKLMMLEAEINFLEQTVNSDFLDHL